MLKFHRKAVSSAKFYFFDIGVCNHLAGRRSIEPHTELFGKSFEQLIFTELRAWLDYSNDHRPLTFWRDYNGNEVDFIIGDDVAIEVKSSRMVSKKHTKCLQMFARTVHPKFSIVVSMDQSHRLMEGGIEVLPWREFLKRLWSNAYV